MTAALIIAAGKAREQRQFDPGKKVGDTNAIKRCILTFQQAGVERVVVCGADEDRVEKLAPHMNASFLHTSKNGQMLDSIKVGLRFLQGKCGAVLIVHTDIPLFSVETVRQLLNANGDLCIPVYQGRPGHPIRMAAGWIPQVLSYQGDHGLAGAIRAAGVPRTLLEVEDEGVLAHVQDRDACQQVLSHWQETLRPAFRFQLLGKTLFYGPGAHQLLQLTQELGSLLDACRCMGISYTKGRKIIANIEQNMGCPVLERTRGGKTGGASSVTPTGQALIGNYNEFCKAGEAYLAELFCQFFPS